MLKFDREMPAMCRRCWFYREATWGMCALSDRQIVNIHDDKRQPWCELEKDEFIMPASEPLAQTPGQLPTTHNGKAEDHFKQFAYVHWMDHKERWFENNQPTPADMREYAKMYHLEQKEEQ